ncbi:M48 family metallopeptidase [uncultured Jatrophihabitans sp.]|uniref:M48 family metallopeptidase n=1 Tax=uncultured Jatrophihabitans sp. TaxID=1610747 RepID=UPI0035C98C80
MSEPSVDAAGRAVLTGISSRAFEHPADRAALTALRSVPGFDQLIRLASGMLRERQYRLAYLASSVRVGPRQFPDLDALLTEVVGVLDAPERPELYVVNDPMPNAVTLGVDRPFIAVTSGLYELTDDAERRVVLGHELGHAMSGHALYQSLLMHLLNLAGSFGWVPAGGLGLRALIAALREWERKAELSGDRAGLLASQDVDAALRLQMKLAGGAHLDRIDADAFLAQAQEYESAGDLRDGVLKLLNTERTSHPFSVVRAAEIQRWASSEEFGRIVAGDYPLRSDDREASFGETAKEAARAYRTRIEESTDPLVGAVRGVGATVGTAAESVVDWFSRMARGPETSGRHADHRGETGAGPDPEPEPGV